MILNLSFSRGFFSIFTKIDAMKKIIFLGFILSQTLLFSQQKIKIVDLETKKPVSYAKINFKDKDYYKNTEENGEITLENNEEPLEIESFGYEKYTISKLEPIYYLQPKYNNIEAINIEKPKNTEVFRLGTTKKGSYLFGASKVNWTILMFFKNNIHENNLYIKKIKIPTEVKKTKKDAIFNLIIYENNDENPSDEKLKTIVVTAKPGKNITEIDLSKNPIFLPKEGIFIGVEWIMNEQNKYLEKITILNSDGSKEKNVIRERTNPFFFVSDKSNFSPKNVYLNHKLLSTKNNLAIELELTN